MNKFYEIAGIEDLYARFNFVNGPLITYCLNSMKFPTPFYMVGMPRLAGTRYEQHQFLLTWLVENDDCRGDYLVSLDNGYVFFRNKEDATLFYITFADVTFK
jgi:hypothetical protein